MYLHGLTFSRNNTFRRIPSSGITNELTKRHSGFAHLALRSTAERILFATKDFEERHPGDMYILDEVYGN